jgi:GntR family transcriptional regulator
MPDTASTPRVEKLSPLSKSLLDERLPTPLYHQIFTIVRDRIKSGAFGHGAVLPGEQELAKIFGVSRITVKRALNELANAGLVSRQRGRGTAVTFNAHMPVVKGSFENLLDSLRVMGLSTEVELIRAAPAEAPAEVAELLGLQPGASVQKALRLRKIEGEPFSFLITYVPMDIARRFNAEDLAHTPLLKLLEDAGSEAVEAEQWITACAAEGLAAQHLKIMPGAPLLNIIRVMRDAEGRGVEVLHGYYRPERFQHHMTLTRRRRRGRDEWK